MKTKKNRNGSIEIHRTRTKLFGGTRNAYRVKLIGVNGEILQTSEAFNDKKAVQTHVKALCKIFNREFFEYLPTIVDKTNNNEFKKFISDSETLPNPLDVEGGEVVVLKRKKK